MHHNKFGEYSTVGGGIASYFLGKIAIVQTWAWHETWTALASLGSFLGGLAAIGGLVWMIVRHFRDQLERNLAIRDQLIREQVAREQIHDQLVRSQALKQETERILAEKSLAERAQVDREQTERGLAERAQADRTETERVLAEGCVRDAEPNRQ